MSAERFPYKLKDVHKLIGYSPLVFDAKFFGEGDLKKVGGHLFQEPLPRRHFPGSIPGAASKCYLPPGLRQISQS